MDPLTGDAQASLGSDAPPPTEVVPFVRLLAMSVAVALESLHVELAAAGHPTLRPVQGFALNAIGTGVTTASALAVRLGMTKQGAAKLVHGLLAEGYLEMGTRPDDGRQKPLVLSELGRSAVSTSVDVQAEIERRWAGVVGPERIAVARAALQEAVLAQNGGVLPAVRPTW